MGGTAGNAESQASVFQKIIASAIGGAVATTCIYPIDITKTKLQAQKSRPDGTKLYSSPFDCARKLVQAEGIAGLYRGWPPNVVLVMPEKALKLTLNSVFREHLANPDGSISLGSQCLAGGAAGALQLSCTNPMELLKIQGATIKEKIEKGLIKEAPSYIKLIKDLGFSGLYTGALSTLIRDVPFSMVYFTSYGELKDSLASSDSFSPESAAFAAGAIAGTFAAFISCPMDVVKTRVHAAATPVKLSLGEYASREVDLVKTQFRKIVTNEGYGALMKGVLPRCMIISPLFAITMTVYENILEAFAT